MKLLCIDIGNTRTHFGCVEDNVVSGPGDLPTPKAPGSREEAAADAIETFAAAFHELLGDVDGVSFCTVVPSLTAPLRQAIERAGIPAEQIFHLNAQTCPLPIRYPNPEEIGQDRLAAAVGAHRFAEPPLLVMDLGTAVTFDVVTSAGYEGGIIAPGLELMSRYLHEQTALLPRIDLDEENLLGPIGKSTAEAMKLGCLAGFRGMIHEIHDTLVTRLEHQEKKRVQLIATGGSAPFLPAHWAERLQYRPQLILEGLAAALALSTTPVR